MRALPVPGPGAAGVGVAGRRGVHMSVDGEPVVVGVDSGRLLLPARIGAGSMSIMHFESWLIYMQGAKLLWYYQVFALGVSLLPSMAIYPQYLQWVIQQQLSNSTTRMLNPDPPELQPPLRDYLPAPATGLTRVTSRVYHIAKSLLSYFRQPAQQIGQQQQATPAQEYKDKAQVKRQKRFSKLIKFSKEDSEEEEISDLPVEEAKVMEAATPAKPIVHARPNKKDEVIIYASRQKFTSQKKLTLTPRPSLLLSNQRPSTMKVQSSSQQLEYSDSQHSSSLQMNPLLQSEPEPALEPCNIYNETFEVVLPRDAQEQGDDDSLDWDEGRQGKKKTKMREPEYRDYLQELAKKKLAVYRESLDLVNRMHKGLTEQHPRTDKKQRNAQQEPALNDRIYKLGLEKKLEQIKNRMAEKQRKRALISSQSEQEQKFVIQPKKLNISVERVLQIIKQTSTRNNQPPVLPSQVVTPEANKIEIQSLPSNPAPRNGLFGSLNFGNQTPNIFGKKLEEQVPQGLLFSSGQLNFLSKPLAGGESRILVPLQKLSDIAQSQKQASSVQVDSAENAENAASVQAVPAKDKQFINIKQADPQSQNVNQSEQGEIKSQSEPVDGNVPTSKQESKVMTPSKQNKQQKVEPSSKQQQKEAAGVNASATKVVENPFLKKVQGAADLLPKVISSLSGSNPALSLKLGQTKNIFANLVSAPPPLLPSVEKKPTDVKNEFSTPTKNMFEKPLQRPPLMPPQPIKEPENDESSMFDESEHSVQRGSAVQASPFGAPQQRAYTNSFGFSNPASVDFSSSANLFANATPSSFLKNMPVVDITKSAQMFGMPQAAADVLWGAPKQDKAKKNQPARRSRKPQQQRVYS